MKLQHPGVLDLTTPSSILMIIKKHDQYQQTFTIQKQHQDSRSWSSAGYTMIIPPISWYGYLLLSHDPWLPPHSTNFKLQHHILTLHRPQDYVNIQTASGHSCHNNHSTGSHLHPPPSAPTPWTPAKKQLTLTLTIPSTPPPHTAYANSSHGVWPSLLQLQQHCFPPPPTTPTPTPTPTPTLQQLQQQRHTSATKNVFSVMSLSLYSYFSPSRTNPLLFSCICIISWQCRWHVSECQWHGVSLVFGATTYQQGRCHMWRHQRHYLSMSARHFILSTLPRFFMYVVRYVMNTNHKPQPWH